MYRALLYSALVFTALASACNVINPEERTPAFIQIDEIQFVTDETANPPEGAPSADIRDVWIEVDNQLLGAFELPATIPVLAEGTRDLKIFGGIKFNGRNMDGRQYPFYDFTQSDIDLIPGGITVPDSSAMVMGYIPDLLDFTIIDFEDAGLPLTSTSGSDTTIMRVNNPDSDLEFLGEQVGRITVTPERPFFDIETDVDLALAGQNIIMLEFDYKAETTFFLGAKGIFPSTTSVGLIGINPSNGPDNTFVWKKMYVDLSNVVDFLQNPAEIELFFQGQSDVSEASVYLDNIKVIHPQ